MAKSLEEIEAEFRARFSKEQADPLPETEQEEEPQNEMLIEPEKEPPIESEPETESEPESESEAGSAVEAEVTQEREGFAEAEINQEIETEALPAEDTPKEAEEAEPKPGVWEEFSEPTGELTIQVEESPKERTNKASIISDTLFYFTLIAMVVCAVLFSRGAFGQQTFGGYRFYEVLTTSMESVYPRGSLVLIKEVDTNGLVVGDDITFAKDSNNIITHRIVEIIENYDELGGRGFITKGVENSTPDGEIVLNENVVGKVVKGIPGLGRSLRWLGENLWIILLFFMLLIACSFFLKMFVREGKKKAEQLENKKEKEKYKRMFKEIKDKLLIRIERFRNGEEESPRKKGEQKEEE